MLVRRIARRAMSQVPSTFHALEHSNWGKESTVGAYDQHFGPLTRQCIPDLLAAVGPGHAKRILDVACGPGYAAEAACKEGSTVTGLDFVASMVALASRRLAGAVADGKLTLVEGDACKMPLPDSSFDGVMINFGVLHLPSPEDAFRESFRVLKPGGRLAFTVWAPPTEAEAFAVLHRIVQEHGNPDVELPQGPPFFRFADPKECDEALQAAGFREVETRQVPMMWETEDPYAAFLEGTGRTQALLRGQTSSQSEAIIAALAKECEARQSGAGQAPRFKMACMLTSAIKPEVA